MRKYAHVASAIFCVASLFFLGWQVWRIDYLFQGNANQDSLELVRVTKENWLTAMNALDQEQTQPALEYIALSQGDPTLASRRAILEGRLMLAMGKPRAAEQAFAEALTDLEIRPQALHWLGAAVYAIGNVPLASSHWLEAIAAKPDQAPTHRSLSMYFYDLGATDNAVYHLRELAKLEPKDGRPLRLLALIHKDNEQYEDAAKYYQQALERSLSEATQHEVLIELTESLLKTRNYQQAFETITRCTESNDVRVLKAECLSGLGKNEEAIQELDLVLAVDANHLRALLHRGTLDLEKGNIDGAIATLKRAAQSHPLDFTAHFKLSQALRRGEQNELADQEAAESERIRLIRERFAKLHLDASAKPTDATIRVDLGDTALELQLLDVARNWYQAALTIDPKNEKARNSLNKMQPEPQTTPPSPPLPKQP
jgi:tetratricopeptide (TPR) repeat protein